MIFFELTFLFMIGSLCGWVLEVFFRRFFSIKKWINPGFLNGPYLPMYGVGTAILYGFCQIPLPRWALVLLLFVALTLLEYLTGLIFIKGMKIKLWDYSKQWGNIQGIICPLFSLLWGVVAALFVYLLYEPLNVAATYAATHLWLIFVMGIFYGIFFIDLCLSFKVSLKIRQAAAQFKIAVHYEELKASINEKRKQNKEKLKFFFPFLETSLSDSVKEWSKKKKDDIKAFIEKRKDHE